MKRQRIILLTINEGLAISGVLPTAQPGVEYFARLTGHGGIVPYQWFLDAGTLPAGLTLTTDSDGAAIISGTTSAIGQHEITIMMRDAEGRSVRRSYRLIVQAEPLVISGNAPAGQVGVPYSYTYTAGGGLPTYTFSISSGALPAGLSLNASTGEISGTPTTGESASFRVRVADSQSPPATTDLDDSISVAYATLAVAGAWTGVDVGQSLGGSPRAITGGLAPYSVSLLSGTRPAGVTISVSGSNLTASGDTTAPGTYTWADRVTSADGQHVDLPASLDITYIQNMYVAGQFSSVSSAAHGALARYALDGTHDAAYTPSITSSGTRQVLGLHSLIGDRLLVVGAFTDVNGTARTNVAALLADGTLDTAFALTAITGNVNCIELQSDGKILVGCATSPGIRRFNADGSSDSSFASVSVSNVLSIAVQSDGKIVIGFNTTVVNATTRNRIARLNPDGTLDLAFNPNASGPVSTIIRLSGDKLLVSGAFTTIGGSTYGRVALLNSDGTVDTGFTNPAVNNAVNRMALQSDGKILVGGPFTVVGGSSRPYLARINANGSLDTGFTCNANNRVDTLAVNPDGSILVGGIFTVIGGQSRNRIALVNADATVAAWNPNADGAVQTVYVG